MAGRWGTGSAAAGSSASRDGGWAQSMSRLGKIEAISPRSWPEEPSFAQHAMISAPWPFLGLPQHETAVQRGSGAPRPSAAVSATDLASLVAIVSLLRARVRRVQRGIVFVVSLARPPFRRPHLARGSACSSKSANWATAKLGQPPRTTTIDSPTKFQRCTTCTSEAMLRHVLNIAPGAALL